MKIKCPACGAENYFTGLENKDKLFCNNCNIHLSKTLRVDKKLSNTNRRSRETKHNVNDEADKTGNKAKQTEKRITKYRNSIFWK